MISNRPSIYLASPLFSLNERQWNTSLRDKLKDFCDVYLPQEDGALLVDLVADGVPVNEAKSTIFARDIEAIERCDILLLVMDGRVIDEGACFELGYAYSRGKLCIGLKTDVRSLTYYWRQPNGGVCASSDFSGHRRCLRLDSKPTLGQSLTSPISNRALVLFSGDRIYNSFGLGSLAI